MRHDVHGFMVWLEAEGYRPMSVRRYAGCVRSTFNKLALENEHPVQSENLGTAMRAYKAYLDKTGAVIEDWKQELVEQWAVHPTEGLSGMQKRRYYQARRRRKQEARSISPEDWLALREAVDEDGSVEARVLAVLMDTGIRIGDLLTVKRTQLNRALDEHGHIAIATKGGGEHVMAVDGARTAWLNLAEVWHGHGGIDVMRLLSPTASTEFYAGHPAYKRADAALKELGEVAGVQGRLHLHRLRRTVAMQALALSGNIVAVQKLMGHATLTTTQNYVDEAQPEDIAELQRRLHTTFQKADK